MAARIAALLARRATPRQAAAPGRLQDEHTRVDRASRVPLAGGVRGGPAFVDALRRLPLSPVVVAAAIHGLGGACFILATLAMARLLPPIEFGAATLIIALGNIGLHAAPSGLSGIVLRHDLRADRSLLYTGLVLMAVTAVVFVAIASAYRLDWLSALVVGAVVLTGGMTLLAQAGLKRAQLFARAALLSQAGNLTLLLAVAAMAAGAGRTAWFPTAAVAALLAVTAVLAWRWLRVHRPSGRPLRAALWRDGVQFASVTVAAEVLIQMERLLIPTLLTLEDLALFAVIAAVAIAPFRMLERGIETTFTARLRAAPDLSARRALLRREARLVLLLGAAGSFVVLLLGRPIAMLVLGLEAAVSDGLLLAAAGGGMARLFAAAAGSTAAACCTGRELRFVNLGAWLALAVAAAAGHALAGLGLAGLVAGVACGWLVRGATALLAAKPHLHA